ncbi:TonB-dependent receptor [Siphonobacter sp. SORGH_AS_1065]|uniref:TonB-dependent receptor n=1 Tax=Siphonobacter sp. SORGH_AS_1065 TaxID=3041795 RepID=UPI0027895043|nr:TonB-dependent receptor [Siphonobacter sp. SORGH_AS_1065]MDQ1090100.1 iron complex outermembrane receptor protein [Siphonobacter sp. SORGH_AS_1065]
MIIRISGVLLLCLFFLSSQAQVIIKGRVREAQAPQRALSGASVQITATQQGTVTNEDGYFEIQATTPVSSLTISHVGYQSQRIVWTSDTSFIEVSLVMADGQGLKEVTVTSKYYKPYHLSTVSSALRLQTPLIHLSQNIQEVSADVIYDQGSFNMTDGVARNVSGVIRQEVSNNLGPYMFMRGGQISTLRNGIDLTPIYRGPVPEDAAIIDRVEFMKGPSLFMNNIGDPAGTFNVVTKQPTGTPHYSATAMGGSWNFYRLAVDLDDVLDAKKKLQYRLNVMGMTSKSFVTYDFNRRLLVAPVLKYQFSDRTSLTAEYNYQQFGYALMSPIVMTPNGFATLPRDFTIHEPNLPPYHVRDQTAFLTFSHAFSKNWSVTARGALMQNDYEGIYMWVTGVNTANPNVLLRNPKYDLARTQVYSQQAFVNGKIKTAGLTQQILAGIDVNQKRFRADSYVTYDTYTDAAGKMQPRYYPLNINAPEYHIEMPTYQTPGGFSKGNTNQSIRYYSLYALDELTFLKDKLRLTLGGRFTSVETRNNVSAVITSSKDQVFTPRVGVNYSVLPSFSVYALLDQTLIPQAGLMSNGEAIRPLEGLNREIGLKKDWLEGRWNTTLSFYSIKRNNIVATDPNNALYRLQVGKTHARGIELDVVGELAPGLNAVINYAYNDSKIDADVNPALVGARPPMYVKHVQNTWLNYQLPGRVLSAFSVSAGYQYQGGRGERYATAVVHSTPDFFRLDGGLGWHHKRLKANLLINNILNKNLIATPWFRNGLYYWVPQAPINARLSVHYVI